MNVGTPHIAANPKANLRPSMGSENKGHLPAQEVSPSLVSICLLGTHPSPQGQLIFAEPHHKTFVAVLRPYVAGQQHGSRGSTLPRRW